MIKQIEAMLKIMNETCNVYDEVGNHIRNKCGECEFWSKENHCCCSYNTKEAEALYNAGYRKSSEIAREIFEEIEKLMEKLDKRHLSCGNPKQSWGVRSAMTEIIKLKKKYTESEDTE